MDDADQDVLAAGEFYVVAPHWTDCCQAQVERNGCRQPAISTMLSRIIGGGGSSASVSTTRGLTFEVFTPETARCLGLLRVPIERLAERYSSGNLVQSAGGFLANPPTAIECDLPGYLFCGALAAWAIILTESLAERILTDSQNHF